MNHGKPHNPFNIILMEIFNTSFFTFKYFFQFKLLTRVIILGLYTGKYKSGHILLIEYIPLTVLHTLLLSWKYPIFLTYISDYMDPIWTIWEKLFLKFSQAIWFSRILNNTLEVEWCNEEEGSEKNEEMELAETCACAE